MATIRKEDLTPEDPLRLVVEGDVVVLSVEVLYRNRPANKIRLAPNPDANAIHIEFDFLDHKNGAVFAVSHTGDGDTIDIAGT